MACGRGFDSPRIHQLLGFARSLANAARGLPKPSAPRLFLGDPFAASAAVPRCPLLGVEAEAAEHGDPLVAAAIAEGLPPRAGDQRLEPRPVAVAPEVWRRDDGEEKAGKEGRGGRHDGWRNGLGHLQVPG